MNKVMKTCFASVVSELQQSDIFMTVKARLLETPKANLNGVRVTPAFVDEVVSNQEKYVGLPLVADVKALANGHYDHLGHLYDARTGQFHTTQIGSFYKFDKEDFEGGSYLVGYARIAKRNKALCRAVAELFADGALKFSFEISCGESQELSDGTIQIDVADSNFLEGEAIVSFPACEDAVALELVAECDRIADDLRKGENEMTDVKEAAEVRVDEMAAEETVAEVTPTEESDKETETAAVHVTEVHEEHDTTYAYDTDTGKEVVTTTSIETRVSDILPDVSIAEEKEGEEVPADPEAAEEAAPVETAADETPSEENDGDETEETEEEETVGDCDPQKKKKTAEEMIAELTEMVSKLSAEIAEMKTQKPVFAEVNTEAVNPFIASIDAVNPQQTKYSLLEKAEPASKYSLLERA